MYSVRKIQWKPLLFSLLISLGIGTLSGFLIRNNTGFYRTVNRPALSPPGSVFPIVWTILYILMAISAYLVYESNPGCRKPALTVYAVQLAVNFVWPLIFFNLEAYLSAFIVLLLLCVLVLGMIVLFYRCSRPAAFLQIPYFLWLIFAAYLNYGIFILNR